MTFLHLLFLLFASLAVISALLVVASNNPVRGVLFLVLTFFATSGIWIILHAEFLALILVLVYVGAVMTLFLFVVMMLNVDVVTLKKGFVRYLPLGAFIVVCMIGLMVLVVGPHRFGLSQMPFPIIKGSDYSNTKALGLVLYTNYVYPFEIAAVLLLTAIVAAISLTHRLPKHRKVQNIDNQIAVKRSDRIKLVNVPSEPKNPLTMKENTL